MAKPRMMRYAAWAAVAAVVIVLVGAGYAALNHAFQTGYDVRSAASIGGPFRLVSQTGATVTDRDLVGHPSLMFFGYTSCPDVCPTTLADVRTAITQAGVPAKLIMVTVDPARDTPAWMKTYLDAYKAGFIGLTGTDAEIARFCSVDWGVTFPMFSKIEVNGPRAHPLYRALKRAKRGVLGSSAIKWNFTKFVVGRDGRVRARYGPNEDPASLAAPIERATARLRAPWRDGLRAGEHVRLV